VPAPVSAAGVPVFVAAAAGLLDAGALVAGGVVALVGPVVLGIRAPKASWLARFRAEFRLGSGSLSGWRRPD
jgi:hypothetical protein